jgi:hypothetical protein
MRLPRTVTTRVLSAAAAGALAVGALAGTTAGAQTPSAGSTTSSGATSRGPASSTTTSVVADENAGLTAQEVLEANLSYAETASLADSAWDTADEVAISLDGGTASASGSGADGVTVDGSTVTITQPGTYRLSGTLSDGQVVVESADDGVVRLVLDGVDITSSTGAAIDVQDADQVSVVLATGSDNLLEDAEIYADTESDNAANAALYSTADLAISGGGSLAVMAKSNDGISGKDGLVIAGGDIAVNAVDDAVRGKDYLVVTGGALSLDAGGDGLQSDADDDATAGYVALLGGEVSIAAASDGVQGFTDVAIVDGTLTVTQSEEGIEAATIAISGGTVDVVASDDALNATVKEADSAGTTTDDTATDDGATDDTTDGGMPAGPGGDGGMSVQEGASLTVTGGTVHVTADRDGFDSNGVIVVTGGTSVIEAASGAGGEGALDPNGTTTVTGGTMLTAGNATVSSVDGDQPWITLDGSVSAGDVVEVVSDDGTVVASATLTQDATAIAATSSDLTAGETYTVTADGQTLGTATAGDAPAGGMGGGMRGAPRG